MKKVLLYSGGMDSWLIDKLWKPDLKLFIDIGTKSSIAERKRLPNDVVVTELKDLGKFERPSDYILPLRNIYLITLASCYGEHIMLGSTSTDLTHDKTDIFAEKMEDLLNYSWLKQKWTDGKKIKIDFSFRKYTKGQLLKLYCDAGGNWRDAYNQSFSCYTPLNNMECRNCRPCFLKLMAFIENNLIQEKDILTPYVPYIEKKLKESEWKDRLYTREDYKKVLEIIKNG